MKTLEEEAVHEAVHRCMVVADALADKKSEREDAVQMFTAICEELFAEAYSSGEDPVAL